MRQPLTPLAQAAGRQLRRSFRAACCMLLLGTGAAAPGQVSAPAGVQAPARTPAPAGPPAARAATRVVVLSDFNESYGSVHYASTVGDAVRRTAALRPDLVISTGDMIAGQRLAPPLEAVAGPHAASRGPTSDPPGGVHPRAAVAVCGGARARLPGRPRARSQTAARSGRPVPVGPPPRLLPRLEGRRATRQPRLPERGATAADQRSSVARRHRCRPVRCA